MNITLEGRIVVLKIEKKNRKSISIKLTEAGEVLVSAPLYISNERIKELIKSKSKWIIEKLDLMENNKAKQGPIESIMFLGRTYKVNIYEAQESGIRVGIFEEELQIKASKELKDKEDYIKEAIAVWFKRQAALIYKEKAEKYSKILNVYPNKITIKEQKTRWGSCSSRGNLNFNWKVVMAPTEVVNYLVVHELCHLLQMNHSKDFWDLVEAVLPDYRVYREWLKVNGSKLRL
jgi:predicted metal-dependent hydrolase